MRTGAILTADIGNVSTRVSIYDLVDGEYRTIARAQTLTTLGLPADDVSVGLERVLRDLERTLNRKLWAGGRIIQPETLDRDGVDYAIITTSAGRPLRAVVMGLMPDISVESALRALSTSYVEPVEVLTLRSSESEEDKLNKLLLARANVVVLAGGIDKGAKDALLPTLNLLTLALRVMETSVRPLVLYLGNAALADTVSAQLSELTEVVVAPNVRPRFDEEVLEGAQPHIARIYELAKERASGGFMRLGTMSETGLLPTAQSYARVATYFAQTRHENVIAFDIGSASSVIVGVFNGQVRTRINSRKGMGHSALATLDSLGLDAIRAWLPFNASRETLLNYVYNKTVRPALVPYSVEDMFIEHALLRAAARDAVVRARATWAIDREANTLPAVGTLLLGGATLTQTGNPQLTLLLAADCLQPTGVTRVLSDPHGASAGLGALAQVNASAAVQLLEGDALTQLGTIVSISGRPRPNRTAAQLRIQYEGERVDYALKGGQVLCLPLPAGETLDVRISLKGNLTINGKQRLKLTLHGGEGGILFDGRGRTFEAGATVAQRAANLTQWLHQATDAPLIDVPESWLAPLEEDAPPVKAEKPRRERPAKPDKKRGKAATAVLEEDQDPFAALPDAEPAAPVKKQTGPLDDDLDELRRL